MKKLIIFDLDDCLVDTWGCLVPHLIKNSVRAMVSAGLEVQSFDEAVAQFEAINNHSRNGKEALLKFIEAVGADEKYSDVGIQAFYDFNFDYDMNSLPGALEMLQKTHACFALVTKGDLKSQLAKLEKVGIAPKLFSKILCSKTYNKKACYQEIIDELGYHPEDCFVCGDRYETDLLPAKELGMKTICVLWGRGKCFPPKEEEVDFMITDLRNIISIVNQETNQEGGIKKETYKVCILAAGIGSRMEHFTKTFNKALIPVQGKPTICHIVEKFPKEVEIVIAVGYKKETIIDYLTVTYPRRKFTFVEVDKFEGKGTGPGYSLLQCKRELQCPFIFFAADTLVADNVPAPEINWFGVTPVPDTTRFCSAKVEDSRVVRIDDKVRVPGNLAFIGLAGVKDYPHFWEKLTDNTQLIGGEIQVSNGFTSLIEKGMHAQIFKWFDVGVPEAYEYTLKNYPHGEGYEGERPL